MATPWPGYADLIERVMPAVVSVTVKRAAGPEAVTGWREFRGPEGPGGSSDREMFERFMERFFGEGGGRFQMPQMPQMPRGGMPMAAAGTGFIFASDGHIATNNHVIDRADEVDGHPVRRS